MSDWLDQMNILGVTGEYHKDLCHNVDNGKLCLSPAHPTGYTQYYPQYCCGKGHKYLKAGSVPCDGCHLIKPHNFEASRKTKQLTEGKSE